MSAPASIEQASAVTKANPCVGKAADASSRVHAAQKAGSARAGVNATVLYTRAEADRGAASPSICGCVRITCRPFRQSGL
ncbi:hypothetical protein OY671_008689 [Metschnikowia pulcherrima]|nr:hypothetical protein OY671_008689 [Metschnikowia pulcherrima]